MFLMTCYQDFASDSGMIIPINAQCSRGKKKSGPIVSSSQASLRRMQRQTVHELGKTSFLQMNEIQPSFRRQSSNYEEAILEITERWSWKGEKTTGAKYPTCIRYARKMTDPFHCRGHILNSSKDHNSYSKAMNSDFPSSPPLVLSNSGTCNKIKYP